ncbi:unnamed protein product [Triticum turgidum subsp. durum]|uniref:Aspartate aminotransferase n=1 Tax=Triticum turgidum subsp. durum TaxID=4567 RepID=A0A9R1S4J8_TRITD|nr:unnamed protein product [Triticum turgidum subsp. durum]
MPTANVRAAQPSADRRLSTLVRHLLPSSPRTSAATATSADSLQPFPTMASPSVFAGIAQGPEDPILGVTVAYNKDPSPVKVNLGVGAYRTEVRGKPLVLNVVKRAEQMLIHNESRVKEYLPITGLADFNKLSAKLIFGADSPAIQENRVATVQCLSGTGSLRVGGEFLARHYHERTIYIPQPTWGNHPKVFTLAGLTARSYRYYDPATRGLDFQGLLEDLSSAPSVRMFVADGGELLMAQSYAKNMGLYGERVGALSIVCGSADIAVKVESQLKLVIRPMYSNPPLHGASIVATILKDSAMFDEWTVELKAMADRIISMREQLFDALKIRETPGDWSHIIKQIGMFTFTGLNSEQVAFMRQEYHIYMTSDGRISMAGLSSRTVPHLADAIHAAVTKLK